MLGRFCRELMTLLLYVIQPLHFRGIVECIEWEYMPSIFVNAGYETVRDECEFIYGQGSGYLRRKKMCVSGHMEFQNRVGRFFFILFKVFIWG